MKPQVITLHQSSTCGCKRNEQSQGWNGYNYHTKIQEEPRNAWGKKGLKGNVEKFRNKKERVSRYTQQ